MSDHKLDARKRQTIKMLGAVPLMSVPVMGAAGGLAQLSSEAVSRAESAIASLPMAKPRTSMALEIHIINGTAVPENSVLIRNTTNEDMIISRFMPGHIIFDGQHMDLNAAINKNTINANSDALPLVSSAGQSKAFLYDIADAKHFRHVEYVWADHAVAALSEHTSVVTLGAFMADTNAVVYANTKQYVPS